MQRKAVASALLANGAAHSSIRLELAKRFGMTNKATDRLVQTIFDEWRETDAARAEHQRSAQIRRLQSHIVAAREAGKYAAVATLERLLADILGTLEPIRVEVSASVQVQQSVLHVLSSMNAEQIRQLANRQREILALPAAQAVVESTRVDT